MFKAFDISQIKTANDTEMALSKAFQNKERQTLEEIIGQEYEQTSGKYQYYEVT